MKKMSPSDARSCGSRCESVALLQVKGIPFLVFDAGGVLEMFDPKEFSDNVVFEPTLAALKRKLSSVVGAPAFLALLHGTSSLRRSKPNNATWA